MSKEPFSELQRVYSDRVNQVLTSILASLPQGSPLNQAMYHGVLLGGKRLRPFLVYATGKLFHLELENLDAPAAAIECIHAYSLIHDDLPAMDNDDLRRGQPTCHIKYGEANAILAGDALQTLAFSILSDYPMPQVNNESRLMMLKELARSSGAQGMCLGQALDLNAEGQPVDLVQLERIHTYKTGALINAAVKLGAFAANAYSPALLRTLEQFSSAIGLAFQIQDDLLDVIGDTATLGKRVGADQQQHKSTYPALLGITVAKEKAKGLYHEALKALAMLEEQGYDVDLLAHLAHFIIDRDR